MSDASATVLQYAHSTTEAAADSGNAKDEDVVALVQQLLDSLNAANDGIEELKGKPSGGHPPKPDVLAALIAEILKVRFLHLSVFFTS